MTKVILTVILLFPMVAYLTVTVLKSTSKATIFQCLVQYCQRVFLDFEL